MNVEIWLSCIPLNEFGKIYSVVSAIENLFPIGLAQAYAEIWKVSFWIFVKFFSKNNGVVH